MGIRKVSIIISILLLGGYGQLFVSATFAQSPSIGHIQHEYQVKVAKDILMKNYFPYIDSLVQKYDSLTDYKLTEHLLVRSNPWIIDTLKNTDYYYQKSRNSFVYDQKEMIVLPKGAILKIPDYQTAQNLLKAFSRTMIDVNIPEFKLRIYDGPIVLYEFLVRVGRKEKKFLKMSGKTENLETRTGEGIIIGYNKKPRYVNPVNNHEYFLTNRDDGKVTNLPQIPFIVTELNGQRYGQLIHPTTNPETLGKAYSNGCIGTRESDAWVIYYYAPIGTTLKIRYELKVIDRMGDTLLLKDIYKKNM